MKNSAKKQSATVTDFDRGFRDAFSGNPFRATSLEYLNGFRRGQQLTSPSKDEGNQFLSVGRVKAHAGW